MCDKKASRSVHGGDNKHESERKVESDPVFRPMSVAEQSQLALEHDKKGGTYGSYSSALLPGVDGLGGGGY